MPIYGETPDNILGVLEVRQFLLDPSARRTRSACCRHPLWPETMKAIDLLRSFLTHPQGLAFVVDEHGGFEGIVTLADIVEEIISDAVPVAERALYIEAVGERELVASGSRAARRHQ